MTWIRPLVEVLFLGLLPLILIGSGKINGKFRFGILAASGLLMIGDIIFFKVPAAELGLRLDNVTSSIPWYLGLTIIGVVSVVLYSRFKQIAPLNNWRQDPHFWFWFIPISIGQQFVFFGFLQSRLLSFIPVVAAIVFSTIIFACAHLMYRPRSRTFLITFMGGLGFAVLFALTPNLIASSIAHMCLNLIVVQRNLFTFTETNK